MGNPIKNMGAGTPPSLRYPAPELFPTATQMGKGLPGQISGMQTQMNPFINQMLQSSMPGSPQYQDLWNMTARNYMNELTPRYSGAGILTSGPGINAMTQGLGDLGTQFANMQLGNLRSGVGTATAALGAPINMGINAMGSMLGQHPATDPGSPGWVAQMANMLGNAGDIGSFMSPLFGNLGSMGSLFGGGGGGLGSLLNAGNFGAGVSGGGMFDMLGAGAGGGLDFGSLFATVPELAPLAL